jgi:NFU1 iron-sulfur cluster scaffold homolog, mitochondrial
MDVKMMIQSTPNPNALKFVLSVPVKMEGNVTYRNAAECMHNPLAAALFTVSNVSEVYFFDNYITVTQDGNVDWDAIEDQIKKVILDNISGHNPNFQVEEKKQARPAPSSPEVAKIEEILDRTIRPALQMDGGDLQVITLDGNILTVNYQGACGSCPSSSAGTLKAIEGILRDEYNPDMVVELAQL